MRISTLLDPTTLALSRQRGTTVVKRMVLRSPWAGLAGSLRDGFALLRAAYSRPELLGMVSNDQLAGSLVTQLCHAGKIFIDVGAHIGVVTAAVLRQCPAVHVIAIEAVPEKATVLRRRFPAAAVHHCAAGPREGAVSFFVNRSRSAYSSLGKPVRDGDIREIRVAMRPLDALASHQDIDVVKIDVEGAELGVLRGAEQLIAASRPTIMFESGPTHDDGLGYSKEALWQWLDDHRYGVYVPNRVAHLGAGLCREAFVESHYYPRRTTNYFAIPHERRSDLRRQVRALLSL